MKLEYFLMVDRIVALDAAGGIITAHSTVPEDSTVFEGHFPGHALMPGVLLIETMAQTSGFLLLARSGFELMPFLVQVREAKLRSFVPPGTALEVTAQLGQMGSGYAQTRATITADGRKVADAQLMFRILPFPAEELQTQMRDRGREIGMPVAALEPT